jgi:predicted phage terminase large subunit-like protein
MWFTEVMPDRLNNQAESSIVVIQQRTHEDDVSGIALSREMGYTHLMIPMYHDTARHCSTVLWEDPRIEDGELAWPERFPDEITKELQRDKGEYAWAGQYQQSPEPRGGSIIKRHFWQIWEEDRYPEFEYILASLDTAYTEKKENDPSALVVLGVFRDAGGNPKIMLMHAWQERLQFNELVQRVIGTCTATLAPKDYPSYPIDRLLIEGKASGLSVAQEIYRLIGASGKFGIDAIDPKKYGDKVSRVHSIQHIFADEMVYAPDKAWADMVIDQVSVFPKGSHDDLVDAVSMGLRYLRDQGFALRRDESSLAREDDMRYVSPSANLPLYPT